MTWQTKKLANGVEARVVHDVVTDHGQPVEDTYDWYAQDSDGNLWYMGEDTKEYKNGKVAFDRRVVGGRGCGERPARDRACPPIRRRAWPIGRSTTPERPRTTGRSCSTDEQAEVPAGHYAPVVMTRDTTPVEPKVLEFKFYAR